MMSRVQRMYVAVAGTAAAAIVLFVIEAAGRHW